MTLEQLAAGAWSMRCGVEHHAHRRFRRLSEQVARFDAESPLISLLAEASEEEARHARLCDDLAVSLGAAPLQAPASTPRVAPGVLGDRDALLYELVAAGCVAETESMATLTLLLSKMEPGRFKDVVHQIARDEVEHAQAGWAHLAREAARRDLGFLANHLVAMFDVPVVRALFAAPADPLAESEELYAFGVVPHSKKREVFLSVIDEVVLPGFAQCRIDAAPLQAWLKLQSPQLPQSPQVSTD
jgi:hypothetical protein